MNGRKLASAFMLMMIVVSTAKPYFDAAEIALSQVEYNKLEAERPTENVIIDERAYDGQDVNVTLEKSTAYEFYAKDAKSITIDGTKFDGNMTIVSAPTNEEIKVSAESASSLRVTKLETAPVEYVVGTSDVEELNFKYSPVDQVSASVTIDGSPFALQSGDNQLHLDDKGESIEVSVYDPLARVKDQSKLFSKMSTVDPSDEQIVPVYTQGGAIKVDRAVTDSELLNEGQKYSSETNTIDTSIVGDNSFDITVDGADDPVTVDYNIISVSSTEDNSDDSEDGSEAVDSTQVSDTASEEQASSEASEEQVSSEASEEQVSSEASEEQVSSEASEEQVSSEASEEQVSSEASEETSSDRADQVIVDDEESEQTSSEANSSKDKETKWGSTGASNSGHTDQGDAPLSYGKGKISTAEYDEYHTRGFYLGFDTPEFDGNYDSNYTRNGLGDDKNPSIAGNSGRPSSLSRVSTDDESGFLYHVQNPEGYIDIDATKATLDLVIPYENSYNESGQIGIWVDWDNNGSFDSSEYTHVNIQDGHTNPGSMSGGDGYDTGPDNYYRNGAQVSIPIPEGVGSEKTYMRVVLTNDTSDLSNKGNADSYPGLGETEDYPVNVIASEVTCTNANYINTPQMDYDSYELHKVSSGHSTVIDAITFKNIKNPDGQNFNLKISTDSPGEYPLVEPRDFPIAKNAIFTGFDRRGTIGNAKITIETFLASDGRTPYPLPIQITTHDLDNDFQNGMNTFENITNISDAVEIWGEDDNIYNFNDSSIKPRSGTYQYKPGGNFVNQGSRQRASWTTEKRAKHSFTYNSKYFGALSIVVSFPTTFSELPECPIPDTNITKEIVDESGSSDGFAENDEDITYKISVTNPDSSTAAIDVPVRDSMLENLPSYITWDGTFTVEGDQSEYTGDLTEGNFKLNQVEPGATVTITYTLHIGTIPADVAEVANIVTDTGDRPTDCPESDRGVDCDGTIIPVGAADTIISKELVGESITENGVAEDNEDLKYQIHVTNTSEAVNALNVPVRDSILENLPSYITWDGTVTVTGNMNTFTGNLANGSFVLDQVSAGQTVTIEYTLHVGKIPDGVDNVINLVTDNGRDPIEICNPTTEDCSETVCPDEDDCAIVVVPVNPDTVIAKKVVAETGEQDGVAEDDEDVTYKITVTNSSSDIAATNVPVRDSMLENLPDYITWDGTVTLAPSGTSAKGSLEDGSYVIDSIPAGSSVTITYTLHIGTIPDEVDNVINLVTDNGKNPIEICDPSSEDCKEVCPEGNENCAEVVIPTAPDTKIDKELVDESVKADGIAEDNEDLTYKISVTNTSSAVDALNVAVRDSMLENLPSYITWDGTVTVVGDKDTFTGNLGNGSFVLDQVSAGKTVTITYTLHVGTIPDDVENVTNIVTDNGQDPIEICDPSSEDCVETICDESEDCGIVVVPVNPDTTIDKAVTAESGSLDGIVEDNEDVTYTITVTNPDKELPASFVPVKDSMLENLPDFITWDGTYVTDPEDADVTGNLADGSFMINEIPADSSVSISYTLHVGVIPDGVQTIINLVTDNGQDPIEICNPATEDCKEVCPEGDENCSEVVIPTAPDTVITKELTDESIKTDGVAELNEDLTYTISVTNTSSEVAINDVPIRDSNLENLPSYLTWDGTVTVSGNTDKYKGNLGDGSFTLDSIAPSNTVTITYTIHVEDLPEEVTKIDNIVTDTGKDPDTCTGEAVEKDCDEVIVPVNPDTIITKAVVDESTAVDGIIEDNEDITYAITVTNPDESAAVQNVAVRDSILENLSDYPYITWDGTYELDPSSTEVEGDLASGTFMIDQIPADSSVTITYTLHVGTVPDGVDNVINLATDNGKDPIEICDPSSEDCKGICPEGDENCAEVVVPVNPDTLVTKTVADASGDGIAQEGEVLTYTLAVSNPTDVDALNVPVRDSLLENMPDYLTFNDDIVITGSKFTGDLTDGSLVLDKVPAGESVTITFSVTVNSIPNDLAAVDNIVTDNGQDPTDPEFICDEDAQGVDCDEVTTPVESNTTITKELVDESVKADGIAEDNEDLTYKISVTNTSSAVDALNVAVRDSMLENLPSYITWNGTVTVVGDKDTFTGNLGAGTFVLDQVSAGKTVTITYTLHVGTIPDDVENVTNIVTDNGQDPIEICDPSSEDCVETICDESEDCGIVVVPVNPDTTIDKAVTAESGSLDGIVEDNEDVTYTITVTNTNTEAPALDTPVKDSMLENLPDFITWDGTYVTDPEDADVTGNLADGSFMINEIPADSSVSISYTLHVGVIPDGVQTIINLVTDNGQDPIEICNPATEDCKEVCPEGDENCSEVVIPTAPDTVITKELTHESIKTDGVAELNEDLTYTISVTNTSSEVAINDVPIRDSNLENLPSYLTWDGTVTVSGNTDKYKGNLGDGSFTLDSIAPSNTVTITYTIHVEDLPEEVTKIDNIVTDTGKDPDTCTGEAVEKDCDEVIVPVNPDTIITKAVVDESTVVDGIIEDNEDITYAITVTNPDESAAVQNVAVRDSILENLSDYPYITWDGTYELDPSDTVATGDLSDGSFMLDQIPADSSVTITYTLHVGTVPDGVDNVINLATDNGKDPIEICDPSSEDCKGICPEGDENCAEVVVPVNPDTLVTKTVADASGDGIAQEGEVLTYTLAVSNPTDVDALNVPVRDSLLENMPDYLTFNDDIVITGSKFTGDLTDGSLVLDKVPAGESVTITFSVTVNSIPTDLAAVDNIVTDNGQDPTDPEFICDEDAQGVDCDEVTTPVESNTTITKELVDESVKADGIAEDNEDLTYKISVTNTSSAVDALNVAVRDSMLENLPSYITWNGTVTVVGDKDTFTGNLGAGTFVLDQVSAGKTVTITYTLHVGTIPEGETNVTNIVTDNGQDPIEICDPSSEDCVETICDESEDCGIVVVPVNPDTTIDKAVTAESGSLDGIVEDNEDVTYTITVTNPDKELPASFVPVKDSMLENLPDFITWDGTYVTDPEDADVTGNLADGSFMINEIPADSSVSISYTLHVGVIPDGVQTIINLVTDNGQDPIEICNPATEDCKEVCPEGDENCSEVVIPTAPDTVITKELTHESIKTDGVAELNEDLTYTISVTNTSSEVAINDVPIRDSNLENLPSYLTWDGTVTVSGNTDKYKGNLGDGSFTLDSIAPSNTVTITYTIHVEDLPADVTEIDNIVTDTGKDPDTCTGEAVEKDCDEVIVPVNPDTIITKAVVDESNAVDGIIEDNEDITYAITVTNPDESAAVQNVAVRDSILENLSDYPYITWDGTYELDPSDTVATGDLSDGSFMLDQIPADSSVTITYTLHVGTVPDGVDNVINLATDNGKDPIEICDPSSEDCKGICPEGDENCAEVVVPVNPDTLVTKTVADASGDGIAQEGEVLTYTLAVSNPTDVDALNVPVRDSLLENMPDYLTFNDDIVITGSKFTGDLTDGSLVLDKVPAGESVTITFSVTVNSIPTDLAAVDNIVTDNGQDPTDPEFICDEDAQGVDCDEVTTPVQPNTTITKELVDESVKADGIAEDNEDLTYKISVTNTSSAVDALNVAVRDSMLENLPSYITWNGTVTVVGDKDTFTGNLGAGTFVLDQVSAGKTVTITYTLHVGTIPDDVENVTNIVTDNGQDPIEICDPSSEDCVETICDESEDCGIVVVPVNPDTTIDKAVTAESGSLDGIVEDNEDVTYTITVTNTNTEAPALDTPVKDSMLENLPDFITWDGTYVTDPEDADVTGNLADGSFMINEIPADSSVSISYTLHVGVIPDGIQTIINLVTDNGQDPIEICNPATEDCKEVCPEGDENCSEVVIPTAPDTVITKELTDESIKTDGVAELNEDLTYTISVTNTSSEVAINDVPIRDSNLENLPSYLTWDGTVTVSGNTDKYKGNLGDGSFTLDSIAPSNTVTITYTIHVEDLPEEVTKIDNIVTDTGKDPDTCTGEAVEKDCDEVIVPVNPDTIITKAVVDESNAVDGIIEDNEDITYAITVTNPDESAAVQNVAVRDSILENLSDYPYITWDGTYELDPSDTVATGDLSDGSFMLDQIPADSSVTITYTLHVGTVPDGVDNVINLATDNGKNPIEICDPSSEDCKGICPEGDENCAEVVVPVNPDTLVTKTVADASGDGIAQEGEVLTYTLAVSNPTDVDALNVPVRDSLLENMPDYLTFNDDIVITGSEFTGDLTDGSFVLDKVPAGESVTITFSVTVNSIPTDLAAVDNIVTDNGQDPTDPEFICDEDAQGVDCDEVTTPVESNTKITKELVDESVKADGIAEDNEDLTYKISVTNTSSAVDALNVAVRDSMLENLPSYITWNGTVTVVGDKDTFTGNLGAGTFVLDQVSAGKTVTITYTLHVGTIPEGETNVTNIVTDNGQDPIEICDPSSEDCVETICDESEDCGIVVVPVNPDTTIDKAVTAESGSLDGIVEDNEDVTYTITVTNPDKELPASFVPVKDSMLENLPDFITWDGTYVTDPEDADVTGNLADGSFMINEIPADSSVSISYTLHVGVIPDGVQTIINLVTDNGQDPIEICNPATEDCKEVCPEGDENCSEVVIPTAPDTVITKELTHESIKTDGVAELNEDLTYTISVTNTSSEVAINDVPIRDSNLENLPSYLTWDGTVTVSGNTDKYKGNLGDGSFTLDSIAPSNTVTITYTIHVEDLPEEVTKIDNIVTDTGKDPDTCTGEAVEKDCDEVIVPVNPDTIITKAVVDESNAVDGIIEDNEDITYAITVTNPDESAAVQNVAVRDSILENLSDYPYITWDGTYELAPSSTKVEGDLASGTFMIDQIPADSSVTITYTLHVGTVPDGVDNVINLATDNGKDPIEICDPSSEDCKGICPEGDENCAEVVVPVNPDTLVTKTVADASGDGIAQEGEVLTYTLAVSNPTDVDALNVPVRDSLLENMPDYLTFNDDIVITGSKFTGDLTDGSLVLDKVPAGESVTITFSVTVNSIPTDLAAVDNIVTDNGQDPTDPEFICDEDAQGVDCDEVTTPVESNTTITKELVDESVKADGIAEDNEDLTYKISVTNTSSAVDALNVAVRDSMLENLPSYITWNGTVTVVGDKDTFTGNLGAGTFVLDQVSAGKTVTITYTLHVGTIPEGETNVTNIVTDNGQDPIEICDPSSEDCVETICDESEDCGIVVVPVNPDTTIDKAVTAESGSLDGIVEDNEDVTYTITVTNPDKELPASFVPVKDSMLENLPDFITWDGTYVTDPEDADVTGNLADGSFMINEIPADSSVSISYTLHVGVIPDGIQTIINLVTDNGQDPIEICNPATEDCKEVCPEGDENCSEVVIPTAPDTVITKELTHESIKTDGVAELNEDLTYTISVTNTSSEVAINDVPIRDSNLENLPSYLTWDGTVTVSGNTDKYKGNLGDGSFTLDSIAPSNTVTITYTIHVEDLPEEVTKIDNIVTDTGKDPDTCTGEAVEKDCDEVIVPVNPDTIITKAVVDESNAVDGIIEDNEDITYAITVTNPDESAAVQNVAVRDSILENLSDYPYITWDGTYELDPSDTVATGDLSDGSFMLDQIPADSSVTITYTLHVGTVPDGVDNVINLATDNGKDPIEICDPSSEDCKGICPEGDENCAEVVVPVNPDTLVTKTVVDASGDGIAQEGEVLTYTLAVSNPTDVDALNVPVRDSLLENMPDYLTFNDDVVVSGSEFTGDLTDGSLVLDKVPAGESVTITFSVTVNSIPTDLAAVDNIVTDNGQDPTDPEFICDEDAQGVDCDEVTTPVDPETIIEKEIVEESITNDGIIEDNEDVTYAITVTNPNTVANAVDVVVRDSLLENLPSYITWDGTYELDPTDTKVDGDLSTGTFTIAKIPADSSVTITYTLHVGIIPDAIDRLGNLATDNGKDPIEICDPNSEDCKEVCPEGDENCAQVVEPVSPDTTIIKQVSDASGDGVAQVGEVLTYTLTISNDDTIDALNVPVRDSMLENLPKYLTYNDDLAVAGSKYTGDLVSADLVLNKVPAKEFVTITYSVTVDSIPNDIGQVQNIATDNGQDPIEICDPNSEDCNELCPEGDENCSSVVEPVDPETTIVKSIINESIHNDGIIQDNEDIRYQLSITNPNTKADALNVAVRDSLLENLPDYMTWDGEFTLDPSDTGYSGNLSDGSFVLDSVKADSTVTITYTLHVNQVPANVDRIGNLATDNGKDPIEICNPATEDCKEVCPEGDENCSEVVEPVNPDTVINKLVDDASGDGIAQVGEVLNYTIIVKNPTRVNAIDVPVRDTMLENTPAFLSYNNDMKVIGSKYTGDLTKGDLVLNKVAAKESVKITYSVTVNSVPNDVASIDNVATDNGKNPTYCPDPMFGGRQVIDDNCAYTQTPVDPDTLIAKAVVDESGEKPGVVEDNEDITYSLTITNPNEKIEALDVAVRDSMLENLPSYITWDGTFTIDPTDSAHTGDLSDGTFVLGYVAANSSVTITYTLHVGVVPDGVQNVINLATDDGNNPIDICNPATEDCKEVCPEGDENCSEVIIPTAPDTVITKQLTDESIKADGVAEVNEDLTYTIEVTNTSTELAINDVPVRDSILENLPDFLTWDGKVVVSGDTSDYSGDLSAGTFTLDEITPNSTVTIKYTLHVVELPKDVTEIANIVTDTGADPDTCTGDAVEIDCDQVVVPVNPDTLIEKAIIDESILNDGIIEDNEDITYAITVTNPHEDKAVENVTVRDSMLENLPNYITWDGEYAIDPADTAYSGDLAAGTLMIDQIPANSSITITYTLHVGIVPDDVENVINLATDNGQNPIDICNPNKEDCKGICPQGNENCAEVVTPVKPDTTIDKAIIAESGNENGVAESNEAVTYAITVTNTSDQTPALNVPVRDSMLENLPDYITWDGTVEVAGNSNAYTGDLADGTFELDEIAPSQSVSIEYTLEFGKIPGDVEEVVNIVTDNGQNPVEICDPNEEDCSTICDDNDDCAVAEIPTEEPGMDVHTKTGEPADTLIDKSVIDEKDRYKVGNTIKYQVVVSNPTETDAKNVVVRDSLLENTPEYLRYNNDLTVEGSKYKGDIGEGTFTLANVPAHDKVTLVYSMKITSTVPGNTILNIVTDNGSKPTDSKHHTDDSDFTKDFTIKPMHLVDTGSESMIIVILLTMIAICAAALKYRLNLLKS